MWNILWFIKTLQCWIYYGYYIKNPIMWNILCFITMTFSTFLNSHCKQRLTQIQHFSWAHRMASWKGVQSDLADKIDSLPGSLSWRNLSNLRLQCRLAKLAKFKSQETTKAFLKVMESIQRASFSSLLVEVRYYIFFLIVKMVF